MWEIDLTEQVYTLLLSLLTGVVFCLVFDACNLVISRFKLKPSAVFLLDVLGFALIGFFDFCFFLARSNGEIRGYVLLGQLLGFILCRATVSKILSLFISLAFKSLETVFLAIKKVVLRPILTSVKKILIFFNKLKEKYSVFRKKRLKKPNELVYTKENCTQDEK